jgi:glutaredoxin
MEVLSKRLVGSAPHRHARMFGALTLLLLLSFGVWAEGARRVDVYLFWREGCPHCDRAIEFLRRIEQDQPQVRVHFFEVSRNAANRAALIAYADRRKLEDLAVPFTVIGDEVIVGWGGEEFTGAPLLARLQACARTPCPDSLGPILQEVGALGPGQGPPMAEGEPYASAPAAGRAAVPRTIVLPFVGEIALASLSLPALTLFLGALDGFNPCAMWTLVFLIGLLLGMKDRARMWILGAAFIAASAAVYFIFMAAWLNTLLFIGMVVWVRVAVALVALGGGFYYLREYFVNPEAACKITAPESRRRVLERLRSLASEQRFWIALAGIVALAFAVNLIELFCSAGIPAVYTQVLALSQLPAWHYYAYLSLYILVFMLDDLVVFVVAMTTLELAGMTTRYVRWSHLFGGLALLAIGALLLLRPELLAFA